MKQTDRLKLLTAFLVQENFPEHCTSEPFNSVAKSFHMLLRYIKALSSSEHCRSHLASNQCDEIYNLLQSHNQQERFGSSYKCAVQCKGFISVCFPEYAWLFPPSSRNYKIGQIVLIKNLYWCQCHEGQCTAKRARNISQIN